MSNAPVSAAAAAGLADAPVIEAFGLVKEFRGGDGGVIRVLNEVALTVGRGEMVAIVGESGAGKSTLLHMLGALERPSAGRVRLGGQAVESLNEEALDALRNRTVGFVFQFHHLLREFSAVENVMMPLRIAGVPDREARERAEALLERVGLASRLHHRPGALSGGEQQRTAVARALAARPAVLLADEPSGNLDRHNAEQLHDLFAELARDQSLGLVVVTHNQSLAARADRALSLEGGRLVESDVREVG
ncbi:MAG: ABC transporter ATP-binding protein [Gemmatimonas sp.]|jgi:lipoprotein-releasing system ATP-binding protein|uniref:ABC transporter ATP-binding protein n=1 Tax=Gemmatimonas sp. TaxID=1962908 RepID=UPI00391F4F01|nr:ABC transporter ATP-binding protein [Gemmatimonadota bacterium]